jgi:hypothetical protein
MIGVSRGTGDVLAMGAGPRGRFLEGASWQHQTTR